ncbi:hypothetical protein Dimus_011792 [Dionaea muscipula]
MIRRMPPFFNYGKEVSTAMDVENALEMTQSGQFDMIFSEVDAGLKILETIRHIPVVLFANYGSREMVMAARRGGASYFFTKPIGRHEIKNIWQNSWTKVDTPSVGRSQSSEQSALPRAQSSQPFPAPVDDLREPSDLLRSDDHDQFPVGLRVLAVDNDPQGLEHLTSLLRAQRYDVTQAMDASTALEMMRTKPEGFDIIIAELHTYWPYGADFIEIMEGTGDEIPVVIVSESDDGELLKGLVRLGFKVAMKPLREQEIKIIWQWIDSKVLEEKYDD